MLCSSTHHSSFSEWCVLFFPDLRAIHVIFIQNDYYYSVWQWKWAFSSRRPSHPHPKIILSLHNARCCLSHPCAGHILLVHRSASLLQNIAVLQMAVSHHLEGPNFNSRDQLSLVGVHYFTQSPKHLPG